jgi:hypothetical protein
MVGIPLSPACATGTSNTVTKGDGNSHTVGSKRRDREDVVDVTVDRRHAKKNQKKSHRNVSYIPDARKKTHSTCTNSASGTHPALVGVFSIFPLHIEQPEGLAQHADNPSAQVQTQRVSRSMRACCGGALTREGQARTQ